LTSLAVALALAAGGEAKPPPSPLTRRVVLGRSVEGQRIRAIRVGDPASPRKALVVGSMHGDEPAGLSVARALRSRRVSGVDLWVVDTVNPDGLRRGRRQNARGVDLNRNFPHRWRRGPRGRYWGGPRPLSEPESRLVRDLVLALRPSVSIWYHQPWNAVLDCGGDRVRRRYARLAGMRRQCRGRGLPGTVAGWQNATHPGTSAFVVELPAGRIPARAAARHARAAVGVAATRPGGSRGSRGTARPGRPSPGCRGAARASRRGRTSACPRAPRRS
jgi:protein MpaA